MSSRPLILAIDQGTTSTRALVFDQSGHISSSAQLPLKQHFPNDGWVEHDLDAIWADTQNVIKTALQHLPDGASKAIAGIGITNQRETVAVWNKSTGEPIHRAIVWQDRRTADDCARMKSEGHEALIRKKTGLLLDPYFSASKTSWILSHVDSAREKAMRGELACGTIDSFLLWKLTGGKVHATDETNASRTSLYNIHTGDWDDDLLHLFGIPKSMLPSVLTSMAHFGDVTTDLFGKDLTVYGMAGDQQAAAFGQNCIQEGLTKATYGTGCFALIHSGARAIDSTQGLLSTRACRLGDKPEFAIEGSIYTAGSVVEWLRDGPGLIENVGDLDQHVKNAANRDSIYLVPAFTGLGAPHWDSQARAAFFGMTRNTNRSDMVRAALESIAYQTTDLIDSLRKDSLHPNTMRVDGGVSKNDWLMQLTADMTGLMLQRPQNIESTAWGAAKLAGLQAGAWPRAIMNDDNRLTVFSPQMSGEERLSRHAGWEKAVAAARAFANG